MTSTKKSLDDALAKLTSKGKKDAEYNREKHFTEAVNAAFEFILKGFEERVAESKEKGFTRAYLYRWKFESDPKSRKYRFRNIRVMDLVRGKKNEDGTFTLGPLIQRLTDYFKKEFHPDFFVGYQKFKGTDPAEYGLYLSWYKKEEPVSETVSEEST